MLRRAFAGSMLAVALVCGLSITVGGVAAQEKADAKPGDGKVALAEGKLTVQAPAKWVRKQPKSRIVEHEFAIPVVEGDKDEGRFTVMGAGGGVEANIDRWIGQFSQRDGSSTKQKAKIQKMQVGEIEVHYVDIAGDFKDQAGPFAPAVVREDYRMLGAIIVTKKDGQHFLKAYGPKATMAANEKAFQEMVNSLKAN